MRKAFGRIGELLKRFGGRLTPSGCALRVPEAKRGRVPLQERRKGIARLTVRKAVSPVVTSGCPKRSEGGCPCRNEGAYRFPLNS